MTDTTDTPSPAVRQPVAPKQRLASGKLAISVISLLAALIYIAISLHRYAIFQLGEDLALFGQALRGYAEGHAPLASLKNPSGFNLLGDHFTPIIALLAPFYRLWPDIRVLLIAQALLFGVAILVVGLFARRRLGSRWAIGISVALACSWGIVHAVLFDFHEIAFAVPLLAIALVCVADERWTGLVVSTILLWLTKEDCTFLTAGLGLLLLAKRRIWAGLGLGAASVAVFVLLTTLVIPSLSFTGRYIYFDVVDAQPMWQNVLNHLISSQFWVFLLVMGLTLGLGLLSPYVLVMLPVLASRLVSASGVVSASQEYFRLQHHYNATLMVVCFVALIDFLHRLEPSNDETTTGSPGGRLTKLRQAVRRHRFRIAGVGGRSLIAVQVVLLAAGSVFGIGVVIDLGNLNRGPGSCVQCQELVTATEMIPDQVLVAADSYTVSRLVDKASPVLLRPEWTVAAAPPVEVDWVIIDTSSNAYDNLANHWQAELARDLPAWGYRLVWSGILVSVWAKPD